MKPKHFRQGKMSIEGHTNIKVYLYKLITFSRQMITGEKSGLTKIEMYEQAQSVLDEFTERMSM